MKKPDFLLIGAQKSGTSWLWDKLQQHPGTDLPRKKEIHYFGGSEIYRKGAEWYYANFSDCRRDCVTGEASTSYLYDKMPYWFNDERDLVYDATLRSIPRLVAQELPDVRIIAILRDPVSRALSAYRHWIRKGELPPLAGLRRTALEHPKLRIIEYGNYARHLAAWMNVFSPDQFLILIFEEDITGDSSAGLRKVYDFLGLDQEFVPPESEGGLHRSWSWTRSAVSYYSGPLSRFVNNSRLGAFLDRNDFLGSLALRRSDIDFLRELYLPEKAPLEDLLGRPVETWDYGAEMLTAMNA